mgnify:CR=1 FL=1
MSTIHGLPSRLATLAALPARAALATLAFALVALLGACGPGVGGKVDVVGGALGVIIDARGRPLTLPQDPARRIELVKKWQWTLGS